MRRPIRVGPALGSKLDQKCVETLDHADRIGVGLVGLQDRQAIGLRISRLSDEHARTLAAQISNKSRHTARCIVPRIEYKDRKGAGNKRNGSVMEFGSTECLGVQLTGFFQFQSSFASDCQRWAAANGDEAIGGAERGKCWVPIEPSCLRQTL